MELVINGEKRSVASPLTVSKLLAEIGVNPDTIVAELNGTILEKAHYGKSALEDGDVLELIRFVGGG